MPTGGRRETLDLLLRAIDTFSPPVEGAKSALRARLVTTFSFSVLGWVPLLALVLYTISAGSTAALVAFFGLSTAAAPLVMRRWGVEVGANIAAGAALLTILSASVMNGGPDLNTHTILAIVPVVAISLSGARSALGWTVVVLVATIGLYVSDRAGFPFPEDIPLHLRWAFQMIAACAFATTLVGIVLMYEYTRDQFAEALRAREADLSGIVETAPDGLLVIESGGRLRQVNPAAERLFQATATALTGASIERLFPAGLQLGEGAVLTDVLSRRSDGSTFPADVAVGRLADLAGERYVVIVRDVTARHESQRAIAEARDRAIQASLAKSTFLANMSHELRTPLNAILGYAELIGEDLAFGSTSEAQGDLVKIGGAGRHLLSLIDHLLDLSKIEAGKLVLERSVVLLDQLMEEVLTTIRPLAEASGNELVCDIRPPLGTMVTDPLRLRQALLNLLSNATKFTDRGVVTFRAERIAAGDDGPERIRFVVSDSGIGMTDDQLEKIFQDFVQADTTTTRRFGGTGLGLAITRRIVRMMGGEVTVWSAAGQGSRFTLEVPTHPPAAVTTTPSVMLVRGGVLIIDEDGWARETLARTVGGAGIPVAMAPDATIGLALAVRLEPKLVVVNLMSPGKEGWLVLQRLRENPVTRDIPVVVVTLDGDRNLAMALGADHLVDDSVNRDQLLDVIRRLLEAQVGHALVVEDDDDMREVLIRTLGRAGWSVTEALDGEQALAALDIGVPDVIIADLTMPTIDGFEFVSRLRSRATHNHVPVLIITARELSGAELQRLSGQVDRIVQKGDRSQQELLTEVMGMVAVHATPLGVPRTVI